MAELLFYHLTRRRLEQVLPELVVTNDDGFKAVDYSALPLLTIQAVKDLKSENDALKQRVAELGLRARRGRDIRRLAGHPDLLGLAQQLLRERQRRHALRHPVEHARAVRLLAGLQVVPEGDHVGGGLGLAIAEDMRMARHHLRVHPRDHVLQHR